MSRLPEQDKVLFAAAARLAQHRAEAGDISHWCEADDVRFTPESGHWRAIAGCPLCAIFGLVHRSKQATSFDNLWNAEHFRPKLTALGTHI
jgi:hypothetical protein